MGPADDVSVHVEAGSAGTGEPPTTPPGRATAAGHKEVPRLLFLVMLLYLVLLLFVFVLYETWGDFRDALPPTLGPLPIEVPWFGALGGALISLTGIFQHSCAWDDCYRYWHYSRPFIGAVVGGVGALLFFVLSDTATPGSATVNATAFDVVAFLVGYREETFRDLIKRATDLLLKPADTAPAPAPPAPPAT